MRVGRILGRSPDDCNAIATPFPTYLRHTSKNRELQFPLGTVQKPRYDIETHGQHVQIFY